MEIKVNDYVRTKKGYICKILEIHDEYSDDYLDWNDIHSASIRKSRVVKNSPNIIDLIEVGDYVNGLPVRFIEKDRIDIGQTEDYFWLKNKHIKSVLTKEQFEQMEYKIESEVN